MVWHLWKVDKLQSSSDKKKGLLGSEWSVKSYWWIVFKRATKFPDSSFCQFHQKSFSLNLLKISLSFAMRKSFVYCHYLKADEDANIKDKLLTMNANNDFRQGSMLIHQSLIWVGNKSRAINHENLWALQPAIIILLFIAHGKDYLGCLRGMSICENLRQNIFMKL